MIIIGATIQSWYFLLHHPPSIISHQSSIIDHRSSIISHQSIIIKYSFWHTLHFINHFYEWEMTVLDFRFVFSFRPGKFPIPQSLFFHFTPPWTVTNLLNFFVSSPLSSLTLPPFTFFVVLIFSPDNDGNTGNGTLERWVVEDSNHIWDQSFDETQYHDD